MSLVIAKNRKTIERGFRIKSQTDPEQQNEESQRNNKHRCYIKNTIANGSCYLSSIRTIVHR